MSWGDAVSVVREMATDPSSRTAAALQGWRHPVSYEWIALRNLYDLYGASGNFKKPFPTMPTPWGSSGATAPPKDIRERLAQARLQGTYIDDEGLRRYGDGRLVEEAASG